VVQINGEEDDVVAASLRCAFQSAVGTTAFPGRRDMAWRSDGARCGPRRPVGGQPCSGCAFPSFFFVLRSCLMSDDAGCHGLASAAWCGGGGGSSTTRRKMSGSGGSATRRGSSSTTRRSGGGGSMTTTADLAPGGPRVAGPVPSGPACTATERSALVVGGAVGGISGLRRCSLVRAREGPASDAANVTASADIIVSAATSLASLAPSDSSSLHGGPLRRPPPTDASSARRRLTKRGR
jgi:hypothetical protein